MPAAKHRKQDPLTDKLGELESLLARQAGDDNTKQQDSIPVLDELVSKEDYQVHETSHEQAHKNVATAKGPLTTKRPGSTELENVPPNLPHDLARDLAHKLETKLTIELAQAMRVLKDRLKGSIMKELQAELASRRRQARQGRHGADTKSPQ